MDVGGCRGRGRGGFSGRDYTGVECECGAVDVDAGAGHGGGWRGDRAGLCFFAATGGYCDAHAAVVRHYDQYPVGRADHVGDLFRLALRILVDPPLDDWWG